MKLLIAIVQDSDMPILRDELVSAGFYMTKLATSGGFLKEGNTTILLGIEEQKIEECLNIIKENCRKRETMTVTDFSSAATTQGLLFQSIPVKIEVGGATVFVLDVDQFHKF